MSVPSSLSKHNTKKERRNSEVENHTENSNELLSLSLSLLTRVSFLIYVFLFSQKRYGSRAVTKHGNKEIKEIQIQAEEKERLKQAINSKQGDNSWGLYPNRSYLSPYLHFFFSSILCVHYHFLKIVHIQSHFSQSIFYTRV